MMNYLIVEDEPALGETLRAYLAKDGQALLATSLAQANERVAQISPDVIILDLSMPDGDGLTWLAQWRKHLTAKVIVLTANDEELTMLKGLRLADDYVVKPVSLRVLKARIAKQLPMTVQQFGAVSLNLATGQVTKNETAVVLTAAEYRLLAYFFANPNQILARDQLLAALWDTREQFVADNTLTVTIKRLREKLEDDPAHPTLIRTVRGMGYFIDG